MKGFAIPVSHNDRKDSELYSNPENWYGFPDTRSLASLTPGDTVYYPAG